MATSGRRLDESTQRRIQRMTRERIPWSTIMRECDVCRQTVAEYRAGDNDRMPVSDCGLDSFDASDAERLEAG